MKLNDLPLPHEPGQGTLDGHTWLIYAAIVIVNAISWLMTSQGFIISGYMPMDGFVPGEWIPRLLIACSQVFLAFFFQEAARTRIGLANVGIFTFLAIIASANLFFEVLFSMASVSEHARGSAYLSDVINRVKSVDAKVIDVDTQIVATYSNQVNELERLARDAAKGRDRTELAGCGEICRRYWDKAHDVRQNFTALGIPLDTGVVAKVDDVNRLWLGTKARLDRLKQKAESFATFIDEENLHAFQIGSLVNSLDSDARDVEKTFFTGKGIVDVTTLTINHTFANLKDVLTASASERSVYIAFFAAILPVIIHAGLWLLLALCARNAAALATTELSRAKADLEERSCLLDQLLDLQTKVEMDEFTLDQKKNMGRQFRNAMRTAGSMQ